MLTDRRDLDCFLRTLEFAMEKSRDLAEKLLVMYPTYNAHVIINEFVFKELIQDYCSTEVTSMVQFLNGLIDEELDKKRRKLEILKAKQEAESTLLSGFAGRLLGQEETSIELELDPEIPLKFIVRAQEAIHRATLLSGDDLFAGRQSSNLKTIFKTVIREFGQKYMLKCVDRVVQKITVDEPRTEPQTEIFFNMIALTNSNMILIQKIFFENIKPHFATENARNDLTLCIKEKQQLTTELEDLVIQGLTKCLNTMVTWVRKLLSRDQGRNDFRPAEDEISIGESTKACNSVCSFIQKQHNLITTSLDGKNLTLFLSEFGRRLLETILNHIRNFTISYGTGGLALMTDFRKYRETIGKFSIPGLDHELDMLYHIEKIYMVKAEELKGIIEESPLKNMKPSELDSYISKRSDYRSAWVGKFY
uniref:Exocyst complex component Sec10-like alpha-helical bundle domain-containing protein n=1 Tax=Arcella intermedia TaxID=1963864 RepID=A0A6B2L344_9EUKA